MTTTATASATTSVSPTSRGLWRSGRGPAMVGVLVVLAALVIAWVSSGDRVGFLDPDSVSATGSRAVAEILREQGVEVVRADGVAAATQAGPGDTLVLSQPDLLSLEQVQELVSTGADLVVVGAVREDVVQALAPDLTTLPAGRSEVLDPDCELPLAVRAGRASTGVTTYPVAPGAPPLAACYPVEGDPSLVVLDEGGRLLVLLGSSAALENDQLAKEGNAALALGLLGARDRVVWHVPSVADLPTEPQASFFDLVPLWVTGLVLQVGLAVVLLALWRARRLGPVVPETLPVVVRAAEATEGRGRMYRRAGARDRAAERLRDATRSRLAPSLGQPGRVDPATLVAAVARRTGRPGVAVQGLLYGGSPTDDAALVRLADDLDALEREVRPSSGR